MDISVIIPAYNEAKSLPLLVEKVDRAFKKGEIDGELLIVDDGSTDNTFQVLNELKKQYSFLEVLRHNINLGLTKSLIDLFQNAKGDVLIFLPADLESDPEKDIPILLGVIKKGYDVVCGRRRERYEGKLIMSKFYNWLSRKLFKIKLHDANWIKAIRKEIVKDLELRSDWHRFIPIILFKKGYKVSEVYVDYQKRRFGKSKFGVGRLVKGLLDMLVLKLLFSFGEKPMFIFGIMSILFLFAGVGIGGYLIYYQQFIGSISRPLLFLDLLLLLLSAQLFAMGFLAELIISRKN